MSERLTKFAQQVADEEVQSLRAEVARLRLTTAEVAVLNRAIGLIERRAEETSCIHVAGYLIEDAETIRGIQKRLRRDP